MRLPGFIGGAYTIRALTASSQRCVNLYPEMNETGTAPNAEAGTLVSTPGLRKLATIGTGPIRGMARISITGKLAVVSGQELYYVDSDWTATLMGVLATSTGPVDITSNLYQVCIVDGNGGYCYDATKSDKLFKIPGFPASDRAGFLDNYILFNITGTGTFGFSALNDVSTIDPLDHQTVEGSPDNLVGLVVSNRQIWLPGTDSAEVYINVGDAANPFQRIPGAFIEFGCDSPFAFQKIGNSVMWIGGGENGAGIVWRAEGYQPARVSTHAIELALQASGDLTNARAWTYQQDGHQFYCVTIPGQPTTWVYDLATNVWHERVNFKLGAEMRFRGDCHAYAYDTHVVGDYEDGRIYALDFDQYTDDGDAIIRERTTPHLGNDGKRIFWDFLQVEARMGVGSTASTDPQIMLQWSTDAGLTWTPERWTSLGTVGSYVARAIWRRMGFSRYRVLRIKVSSPVSVSFLGASIGIRAGGN